MDTKSADYNKIKNKFSGLSFNFRLKFNSLEMFPEMVSISSRPPILLAAAFLLASTCMTVAEADTCTNCKVTDMKMVTCNDSDGDYSLDDARYGNGEIYVTGVCCCTFYTNPLAAWRNIGTDDIYVTGARCRVEG